MPYSYLLVPAVWLAGGVTLYLLAFVWAAVFFRPVLRYGYVESTLPKHDNLAFITLAAVIYPWSARHILYHGHTSCCSMAILNQRLLWSNLGPSIFGFPYWFVVIVMGWVVYISTLLYLLSGLVGLWWYQSYQEHEPDENMKYF